MQRIQFNYWLKNIGLPSQNQYRRCLIDKVESVVHRMRWKAHFFLNGQVNTTSRRKFGLPSKSSAAPVNEMKAFEEDLVNMMNNVSFRNVRDPFLNNIYEDIKKVNSSQNVLIFADKTRNMYEAEPATYKKLLQENITKAYKHGNENMMDDINHELKTITSNLAIGDRLDTMAKKPAFITLKDHKDNFESNPKCRLINPAKSELGKVSKAILDIINDDIKSSINVNQWKNSQAVIEWFKNIIDKPNHSFVSFDVVEFYPSITEELLDQAISWAKSFSDIPDEHVTIIKHARKSLLFSDDQPWVKRTNESMFDVTMGSFDGAEICDLIGLYILNDLVQKFGNDNIGLYRDDGLILIDGTNGRVADKARKEVHECFEKFGLKITAEIKHHVVDFLDVTLNLQDGTYKPFRKANNDPLYIDSRSNHPPCIIKQLPLSVNRRISSLSSDQSTFNSAVPLYEDALRRSHFHTRLEFQPDNNDTISRTNRRRRHRNVIWFNPPFSKTVKTNIARSFLQLIDKHFPPSSPLHKIFNRNTIKASYSCMPNVKSTISQHNNRVLRQTTNTVETRKCNCRVPAQCPLQGSCLEKSIVYQADVECPDDGEVKHYIGMTSNTFKERYANHKKSFGNPIYASETELSKYVWKLKETGKPFSIKWRVLKKATTYTAGSKRCNLCLEEKLCLLQADRFSTLNRRSEIFTKCRHKSRLTAGKFKRLLR